MNLTFTLMLQTDMFCPYRFVRFVSTPEILERVYTLESEILQIEEAIAIQSNNDIGLNMVSKTLKKGIIKKSDPITEYELPFGFTGRRSSSKTCGAH